MLLILNYVVIEWRLLTGENIGGCNITIYRDNMVVFMKAYVNIIFDIDENGCLKWC